MAMTPWEIDDEGEEVMMDKASEFKKFLSIGLSESEAASDAGIDSSLAQEWLKDREFAEMVNEERLLFKKRIRNSIKIKSLMSGKENAHRAFSVSCDFMLHDFNTENHKKLIIKQSLPEIKKAVLKASVPQHQKPKIAKKGKKARRTV